MEEVKVKRTRRKKRAKEPPKPTVDIENDHPDKNTESKDQENVIETVEQKVVVTETVTAEEDTIEVLEEKIVTQVSIEVTEEKNDDENQDKEEKDDSKKRFNFGTKLKSLNPLKKFTKDKKKLSIEEGNVSLDIEDGKSNISDREEEKGDEDNSDQKRSKGK